ncbi:hypothetical protein EX895_003124 [Sporisorium graminicola]|uniref:Myosin-binding domain-containing protein n=1 Tax=Sporisorium graminicola TaxID=280036 RepID=A0A4U7KX74_9BASI|nr:hypothetical protein EX895_003124 [Sporisorium graminicola]TKY88028.1 hypothetical protein EX895_003124 [Sporisorium graminicola]
MAEPVIFGGSPLDQYLQNADQAEGQPFLDDLDRNGAPSQSSMPGLGLHLTSTPPRNSSTSISRRGHDLESRDSTRSREPTSRETATTASSGSSRKEADDPSRRAQSSVIADKEDRHSLHSLTAQEPVSNPTQEQILSSDFAPQLVSALRTLIRRVLLPLVVAIAHRLFGWWPTNAATDLAREDASRSTQRTPATETLNDDDSSSSFVERFKYVICSSFLLTPTLSISFYGSSPPVQMPHTSNDGATGDKRTSSLVRGRRASPTSIRKQCCVEPVNAPARDGDSTIADTHGRLPRLDARERTARNAALLSAVFLIPPISASWRLWFSTLLVVVCLTWGFVALLNHSSLDETIEFTLSRQPDIHATASPVSLRNFAMTDDWSHSEREALQTAILRDVSNLIKAAQDFDVSVNKAISAIQEVEIVSRGYKLTHPLPPISRIEAASGWSTVVSPNGQRRSMTAASGQANGKLGRSLSSGGNGAPTIRRHAQRPLSLSLSNGRTSPMDRASGRASPGVLFEAGEVDHIQKLLAEQSTAPFADGRAVPHRAPQRLIDLRKTLVAALEGVGVTFTSSNASLQILADAEELAMLHDLYALDASPQDDVDDADVSHAWSHADTSAISESSPDLEHDRKPWVATTPRNFGSNVRAAELAGYTDLAWRSDLSPQASLNHKRLSLVSDASSVLDRHPRAPSSLSRRSSLVSESGKLASYRSPRFNYVSEQATGASGPNESAAAKRLSYISNSNSSFASGSFDTRSPVMRNSSVVSSAFTPPQSSAQTYSSATSPRSRATKRSSILGPNSIFAQLDPPLTAISSTKSAEPLSLMSIKAKFEWMHRARRRWLCHLLALHLKMRGCVDLTTGENLPCDEYWIAARSTIESASSAMRAQNKIVKEIVEKEMGLDFLRTSRGEAPVVQGRQDARPESQGERLAVPVVDANSHSVVGHPGMEDRLHAMMLSLRSLQSKIRVCAEDIRVKAPSGLHGVENGRSERVVSLSAEAGDDAATALQLERTIESMRDDLLGLSAEWEATVKLIHKEKRRSPSPHPSTDLEADVSKSNAARELESPLEADEDATNPLGGKDGGSKAFSDEVLPLSRRQAQEGDRNDTSDNEDDSDLAVLLLNSTSPNSLPPPGLEQVFESIAGMAGLSGLGTGGTKLSRAERIEQTRLQRQQEQESRALAKASQRHSMDPSGMMSELNDVISTRKAVRDQRHQSALPLSAAMTNGPSASSAQKASAPLFEAQPALALGSPLDLGSAGREGVFGASHSFVDDHAMPRRSLSSLDLARARALQALEARSPSVASSASVSFDSGDESQSRRSEDFSFEPTALESVPENDAATEALLTTIPNPSESPLAAWDSGSRKSTPKASQVPLSTSDATPVPDSPFDLGAQVAAYARRKKAARAQAAAMQASGSESSMSSSLVSSNHES